MLTLLYIIGHDWGNKRWGVVPPQGGAESKGGEGVTGECARCQGPGS